MKYTIQITPDDKIKVMEYTDYHTINDLVDGWYERCGVFGVLDKMCMIFCNEEFLYQDNCVNNIYCSRYHFGMVCRIYYIFYP